MTDSYSPLETSTQYLAIETKTRIQKLIEKQRIVVQSSIIFRDQQTATKHQQLEIFLETVFNQMRHNQKAHFIIIIVVVVFPVWIRGENFEILVLVPTCVSTVDAHVL